MTFTPDDWAILTLSLLCFCAGFAFALACAFWKIRRLQRMPTATKDAPDPNSANDAAIVSQKTPPKPQPLTVLISAMRDQLATLDTRDPPKEWLAHLADRLDEHLDYTASLERGVDESDVEIKKLRRAVVECSQEYYGVGGIGMKNTRERRQRIAHEVLQGEGMSKQRTGPR
jgi:hypothetical protein